MALTPGTSLGPYVIEAPLGAGGMGEVYRARDTKLHRAVAIKVLPGLLASDPERRARFEREAQLLAAFNHPHIAQIYGIVETVDDGPRSAIVMELVDGVSLAERIGEGAIPLAETLAIAAQIVDALDTAHTRGIVHRDLKPSNIQLDAEGRVKVLDFGLAKMNGAETAGGDAINSPTFTSRGTALGMILGTAAYMSPEQARGKPVDKRADIWAFGCVVYEMLTGHRVFGGTEASDILAAVLRADLDWTTLPRDTPPPLRRLLAHCLERDPNRRLRDIGDARFELDAAAHEPAESPLRESERRRRSRLWTPMLVAGMAVLTALAVWALKPQPPSPLRKLDVLTDVRAQTVAMYDLSPDGSRIGYVAGGHLWVRDLTQLKPRDIAALPDATNSVVWSRDNQSLLYSSGDGRIRRVPAAGGEPVVICDIPESRRAQGLAWAGSNLVFAVWRGSLYRVDPRGGTPTPWLTLDPKTEIDFHLPVGLGDGRVAFSTHRQNNEFTLETWDGKTRAALLPPMLVMSTAYSRGHLLYVRDEPNQGLWAIPVGRAPLDPAAAFLVDATGRAVKAASDGSLLISASTSPTAFELVVTDRTGLVTKHLGTPASFISNPALSPDGGRVVSLRGTDPGRVELWIQDTATATSTRLTIGQQGDGYPEWFPSGNRIVYTDHMQVVGGERIVSLSATGAGQRRELVQASRSAVSPDGKHLLYQLDDRGARRLRYADLTAEGSLGASTKLFDTSPEPSVTDFALSPDSDLLAYVETTAAGSELFVTRFPSAQGRWQPAMGDARLPRRFERLIRWARSTRELIFPVITNNPDRIRMLAVPVATRDDVTLGQPVTLFETDTPNLAEGFDVSADGKTFVMARPPEQAKGSDTRFILVQNWLAEFARR